MKFILLPPTELMVDLAKIKARQLEKLDLGHGIRLDKDKLFFSSLAEITLTEFLSAALVNTVEYDLLLGTDRIEVKAKDTTVVPRADYDGSVAAYNADQNCDFYAFMRVIKDRSMTYLCGMVSKANYLERRRFMKEGEIDPSNGFRVRADCWNIYYNQIPLPPEVVQLALDTGYEVMEA
jgi:hypothetical protein